MIRRPFPSKSTFQNRTLLILGGLALASSVPATQPVHAVEDARTLPQGRFRLSFNQAQSSNISQMYDHDGVLRDFVAPYQLDLSAETLAGFDASLSQLIDVLNATGLRFDSATAHTDSHGLSLDPEKPLLGDALSRGNLDVQASGVRTLSAFSLQYGVTDRLSVGLLVPIIRTNVQVNARISGDNSALAIYNSFIATDPELLGAFNEIPNALGLIGESDTETLQALLAARGYSRFESRDETGLGDITVGGRYRIWDADTRAGSFISSVQGGVGLPTGALSDPGDITSLDMGAGVFELRSSHVANYTPRLLGDRLTFSHSLNYSHRLPGSRLKRVPLDASDVLPDSSAEEQVNMQLGDKFWTVVGVRARLASWLSVGSTYEWYWRGEDIYTGARSDRDYSLLSNGTASYTETAQAYVSLSSIDAFLKKKFPLPLDLSLNAMWVTGGTDTIAAQFYTAELAMYF